jgi:hypothetical protein
LRKAILILLVLLPVTAEESCYRVTDTDRKALKIIQCESSCRHDVYGDKGLAYGIAQFHKPTFNEFKLKAGRPELNYKSEEDQIWLLKWAIENGRTRHWTCARKLGLISSTEEKRQ